MVANRISLPHASMRNKQGFSNRVLVGIYITFIARVRVEYGELFHEWHRMAIFHDECNK